MKRKSDLFSDLREKEKYLIKSDLKNLKSSLSPLEQEIDSITKERELQIQIVQALRGVVKETGNMSAEARKIVGTISNRKDIIVKLKEKRDSINARVVLPLKAIEEELVKVFQKLTGSMKQFRFPSSKEEIRLFGYFFELQEMHKCAIESSKYHLEMQELWGK